VVEANNDYNFWVTLVESFLFIALSGFQVHYLKKMLDTNVKV